MCERTPFSSAKCFIFFHLGHKHVLVDLYGILYGKVGILYGITTQNIYFLIYFGSFIKKNWFKWHVLLLVKNDP